MLASLQDILQVDKDEVHLLLEKSLHLLFGIFDGFIECEHFQVLVEVLGPMEEIDPVLLQEAIHDAVYVLTLEDTGLDEHAEEVKEVQRERGVCLTGAYSGRSAGAEGSHS